MPTQRIGVATYAVQQGYDWHTGGAADTVDATFGAMTIPAALVDEALAAIQAQMVPGGDLWPGPVIKEVLHTSAAAVPATVVTAASTAVGDVLVCFAGNDFFTVPGAPTGTAGTWNPEATGDNGTNSAHIKVWTRAVTSGGAQTVTVSPVTDEEVWNAVLVISGADTTTPSGGAAGANGASSVSHVAPSVAPGRQYSLLLCGVQGAGSAMTYTPPPGMNELTDDNTADFGAMSTAVEQRPATGATGTRTFTASITDAWAAVSIDATLTVAATLTAAAATDKPVTAALTATATVTAGAASTKPVDASLTAAATITPAAAATKPVDATLTATAAATAAAASTKPIAAALTGTATITAGAAADKPIAAALTITATRTADMTVSSPGQVTIAAAPVFTATITPAAAATKPIDATRLITATITPTVAGAASLAASLPVVATITAAAAVAGAFVPALVGLDGGTSAGTTDSAGRATGATDGRTGSSGHDSMLKAVGSGDGATTATGYL